MKESIVFDTFAIERTYKASPARVFEAWRDPEKKRRWFAEGKGFVIDSYELDFREGAFERTRFRFGDGPPITNDTVFHDIVPSERIVASYGMTRDGKRFSVSLATVELEPHGTGTRLRYTEQGAYFESGGPDASAHRREGCVELLEALAREVEQA